METAKLNKVHSEVTRRWLTTRQVATMLGSPMSTIAKWRKKNRGPHFYSIGAGSLTVARYAIEDVEKYIAECRDRKHPKSLEPVMEEANGIPSFEVYERQRRVHDKLPLSAKMVAYRKGQAVKMFRELRREEDRAREIERMTLEEYAARKGYTVIPEKQMELPLEPVAASDDRPLEHSDVAEVAMIDVVGSVAGALQTIAKAMDVWITAMRGVEG